MRRRLLVLVVLALAACALTVVRGSWVAPDRPAAMGRTLVVGISQETTWSHTFEAWMATSLRNAGVDAVPLSAVEQNGFRMKSSKESLADIDAIVAREGFDSVLVGHLGGRSIDVEPVPYVAFAPWWGSAWGPWWYGPGYYGPGYGYYGPGYYGTTWSVVQTWRVEARLFETAGEQRLVWSMVVTTEDDPLSAIPDIRDAAMDQLSGVGFLPRAASKPAGS